MAVAVSFAPPTNRKLIRDKIDELYAQLSTPTATKSVNPAGGVLKSRSKSAMAVEEEEERAAATLRLLTSMARFHRCNADFFTTIYYALGGGSEFLVTFFACGGVFFFTLRNVFSGYIRGRMKGSSGGRASVNMCITNLEPLLSARGELLDRVRLTQGRPIAPQLCRDAPLILTIMGPSLCKN